MPPSTTPRDALLPYQPIPIDPNSSFTPNLDRVIASLCGSPRSPESCKCRRCQSSQLAPRHATLSRMVDKLISGLSAFIVATISALGYGGVVLMMAIESACIPLPSEIIMPFSGYLVATGRFGSADGRDCGGRWMSAGLLRCVFRGIVGRAAVYRALRPLCTHRAARTRNRRSLFRAMGFAHRLLEPDAAGRPHLHRVSCGRDADEARCRSPSTRCSDHTYGASRSRTSG